MAGEDATSWGSTSGRGATSSKRWVETRRRCERTSSAQNAWHLDIFVAQPGQGRPAGQAASARQDEGGGSTRRRCWHLARRMPSGKTTRHRAASGLPCRALSLNHQRSAYAQNAWHLCSGIFVRTISWRRETSNHSLNHSALALAHACIMPGIIFVFFAAARPPPAAKKEAAKRLLQDANFERLSRSDNFLVLRGYRHIQPIRQLHISGIVRSQPMMQHQPLKVHQR